MIVTPAFIVPRHDLSLIEIDHLENRLYDHNRRSTGRNDGKALGFVAVSQHGIQMGAIAGYSWAGVAEIKLWVDGDHHSVWALSYDFQAPGFYEEQGFERVAELRDWPPGHTHIVLRRSLKADPSP